MRFLRALTLSLLLLVPAALVPAAVVPAAVAEDEPVTVFLTLLDAPDSAVAGDTIRLRFEVEARGPLAAPWLERVRLDAADDLDRPVTLDVEEVTLTPVEPRAVVQGVYDARAVGERSLILRATATRSTATLAVALDVERDAADVQIRGVDGPDARWRVSLDVSAHAERLVAAGEAANLTVHAQYDGDAGEYAWTEGPYEVALPYSGSVPFALAFGAGAYRLAVHVDGERVEGVSKAVRLDVAKPPPGEAEAVVRIVIEDAPTRVVLTSDTVNLHRAKAPGDSVVTRFSVADENGLDDVASLVVRHERLDSSGEWRLVAATNVSVPQDRWRDVSAAFEDSFRESPLPVGEYRAVIVATSQANATASDSRTYNITAVRPTAHALALDRASVSPGKGGDLDGVFDIASRNLGTTAVDGVAPSALGFVDLRVFRGSTQVPWTVSAGPHVGVGIVTADLRGHAAENGTYAYRVEAGAGILSIPIVVEVPPGAAEGSYRVSAYHREFEEDARRLLASVPFEVGAMPVVKTLTASAVILPPGGNVTLDAFVEAGDGVQAIHAQALRGDEILANASLPGFTNDTTVQVNLTLPTPLAAGPLVLRLAAIPADGGAGVTRDLSATVENVAPVVRAAASVHGAPATGVLRLVPPGALTLTAHAEDMNGDAANLTLRVVDWRNAPVPDTLARIDEITAPATASGSAARWRVTLAEALPAGKYRILTTAEDGGGARGHDETALDVGGWVEVNLPDGELDLTEANGRLEGALRVANAGNVAVRALHVTLDGDALFATGRVTLVVDGAVVANVTLQGGRATLQTADGVLPLAAEGLLHLSLERPRALPAGTREARLLLLAEAVS